MFGMRIRSLRVLYLDVGPMDVEPLDVGPVHQAAPRGCVTGSPRDTVFLSRRTARNYLCNIGWSQGILYWLLGWLLCYLKGGHL